MTKKQTIAPFDERNAFMQRRNLLEKVIAYCEKEIAVPPAGRLAVAKGRGAESYRYSIIEKTGDTHGRYLNKSNEKERNKLARQKYYENLLKNAKRELNHINRILDILSNDSLIETYTSLHPGLQKIINPIVVDDETYAKSWLAEEYNKLKFDDEDETKFLSAKGERMRSKSEVLIANELFRQGIPYRYECPLVLKDGKVKYPDFTILIPHLRKIMYWEHLGKMGDIDYVSRNLKKINEYKSIGIYPGKDLIITFENGTNQLGTSEIRGTIREYILG